MILTQPRVYDPGRDITGEVVGATPVLERRLVAIAGTRTNGGNVAVSPAAAGAWALGVAGDAGTAGQLIQVARLGVLRVFAEAALTAGAEVQVGAAAGVVPRTTGVTVGRALAAAAAGGVAEIVWVC